MERFSTVDTSRILAQIEPIEGWFPREHVEVFAAVVPRAIAPFPTHAIVEIGSYCGRSTIVLGSIVQALGLQTKVYAIDPHEGITSNPEGIEHGPSTLDRFKANITRTGLDNVVELIQQKSTDVKWTRPVSFLFIDGLHDYGSVSNDFRHYDPWVVKGGHIAFHDYGHAFHGVTRFVDEVTATSRLSRIRQEGGLLITRKCG